MFKGGVKNLNIKREKVKENTRTAPRHGNGQTFEKGCIDFELENWISISDEDGERDYIEGVGKENLETVKWGQLKLLISEIYLLTFHSYPGDTILYIGAASGEHIYVLAQLFEENKFILYDDREFDHRLYSLENIEIRKRYFTEDDVLEFKGKKNLVLISDIRNLSYDTTFKTQKEKELNEDFVWKDMKLQESWVRNIKPRVSFLKFRLPYAYKSELEKGSKRNYLDGKIIRQVFASKTSSETRLLVLDPDSENEWDLLSYEQKLFYHNTYVRPDGVFNNILTKDETPIYKERGLGNDFDSVFSASILLNYMKSTGTKLSDENLKTMYDFIFDNISEKGVDLLKIKSGTFKL